MRKLIILTIFLTLGIWSQAQVQKVARYVGGVEIGRKYVGGVKVWEKPSTPTGQFTMTTNSTSSTWGDGDTGGNIYIENSGATLHWEVTGAVTASYDGNNPVFDFTTVGDKFITVTSNDDLVGLTYLELNNLQTTNLDVSALINLTELDLENLQLTELNVLALTNLTTLYLYNLQIPNVNPILDDLISIGNVNGNYFASTHCGDPLKIAALAEIWTIVNVDACEEPIVWDYEGVMTVGYTNEFGNDEYGYISGYGGSLNPSLPFTFDDGYISFDTNESKIRLEFLYGILGNNVFTENNIILSVDGTQYALVWNSDITYISDVITNPFPAVGETCDIKLKYTLANPTVTIGGEEYETVTIGTQTWLKRNLHFDDSGGGIYSYNDDTAISDEYGYLYTWDAAMRVDTLVDGWHLPSIAEYTELLNSISTYDENLGWVNADTYLRISDGWETPNNSTNTSGFSAKPTGMFNSLNYIGFPYFGEWWCSDATETSADYFYIQYDIDNHSPQGMNPKYRAQGVRLIKDTP